MPGGTIGGGGDGGGGGIGDGGGSGGTLFRMTVMMGISRMVMVTPRRDESWSGVWACRKVVTSSGPVELAEVKTMDDVTRRLAASTVRVMSSTLATPSESARPWRNSVLLKPCTTPNSSIVPAITKAIVAVYWFEPPGPSGGGDGGEGGGGDGGGGGADGGGGGNAGDPRGVRGGIPGTGGEGGGGGGDVGGRVGGGDGGGGCHGSGGASGGAGGDGGGFM